MNQDGQIYFADEGEIPQEDRDRYKDAVQEARKREFEERLERLSNDLSRINKSHTAA